MKTETVLKDKIVPQRLREARIVSGKTIKEVANELEISSQVVSMYELGHCNITTENFYKLVSIYKMPIKFFFLETESHDSISQIYFRSFSSATKANRDISYITANWIVHNIFKKINELIKFPEVDPLFLKIKQSIAIDRGIDKIESFAKLIRREWQLKEEPIEDLTRLLERKGVIIIKLPLAENIDGFSFWDWSINRPFIFVNSMNNPFRLRMSIAHELAHLFFHDGIDVENFLKQAEEEAKAFASAFILPEKGFSSDLFSINLDSLLFLKSKWKASVSAMLVRCSQLELLDDLRYTYLQKQISRKRWRKVEPGDDSIETENPILLRQAVNLLIEKGFLNKEDILNKMPFPVQLLEQALSLEPDFFTCENNLVTVNFKKPKNNF